MTKKKLVNMLKEARDLLVRQSYTKSYDDDEVHELTNRINLAVTEWCFEDTHKESAEVVWTSRQSGWCEATNAGIHLDDCRAFGRRGVVTGCREETAEQAARFEAMMNEIDAATKGES